MSNFTDFFPAASGGGGGGIPKYQDFTSSGTFTPTQALIDAGGRVAYFAVGGGQRGGDTYNSDYRYGGAGGHIKSGYVTLNATTGCAVTIGAGGTSNGSGGGNTTIAFNSAGGTAITANGGSGGSYSSSGAAGGQRANSGSNQNNASAQSGTIGYGMGGASYVSATEVSPGIHSPIANTGSGSATGNNAAAGFVRITWFE
jgi:hypothetical protein